MNKKEKTIKMLREWWKSDLDIEIPTKGKEKNLIIFGPDNDSHWTDYDSSPRWVFSGKRILLEPMGEYMDEDFKEKMEPYFGESFTLDEAIEFVEDNM